MRSTIQDIVEKVNQLKSELINLYNTAGEYTDEYEVLRDKTQYYLDDLENILNSDLDLYEEEDMKEYLLENFDFEFFNAMDPATFIK